MIHIDKKNKMAVDIALHIPLPSFKIRITRSDSEEIENKPLKYKKKAPAALIQEEEETVHEQ